MLAVVACSGAPALRQATGAPYNPSSTPIAAPGVRHLTLVANSGPFEIHVVEVDLKRSDLTVGAMHALDSLRGPELTSAMVARRMAAGVSVVAAVNADFFDL